MSIQYSIAVTIQFAKCVQWRTGELDVHPYSKYEVDSLDVALIKVEPEPDYPFSAWIVRTLEGQKIGAGETENEAIDDAEYYLMNRSREFQQQIAKVPLSFR